MPAADKIKIVDLTLENIPELGLFCISNPKHPGYQAKLKWLKPRLAEGLKIKMVVGAEGGKPRGFIEYVPGEQAWRAVDAPGYLFIHCLWVQTPEYNGRGYGSRLIATCIEDARKQKLSGVVVIASSGPWLPDRRIFEKNQFKLVETSDRYELWVYPLKRAPNPKLRNWQKRLRTTKHLTLACASQCPYTAMALTTLKETARELDISLKTVELKTCQEAQNAPSGYGVFSLTRNGTLHADHYISPTRFRTIVKKELK
jgi:ribosomal protein S18 acetylase RimI-like enzyme